MTTGSPETPAEVKAPAFCKKTIDLEAGTVTWTFGNGTTRTLVFDDLDDATKIHCGLHGVSQKGGDSYAAAGGDYAFAIAALDATLQNLHNGQFNANRSSGEAAPKGTGELAQALVRLNLMSMEQAANLLAGADAATLKALRANGEIKVAIAELRAERARAKAAATPAGESSLTSVLAGLQG